MGRTSSRLDHNRDASRNWMAWWSIREVWMCEAFGEDSKFFCTRNPSLFGGTRFLYIPIYPCYLFWSNVGTEQKIEIKHSKCFPFSVPREQHVLQIHHSGGMYEVNQPCWGQIRSWCNGLFMRWMKGRRSWAPPFQWLDWARSPFTRKNSIFVDSFPHLSLVKLLILIEHPPLSVA